MNRKITDASKFLSYVLRHQPDAIGIMLDLEGWTDIAALINCAANAGKQLDPNLIQIIVATSDKKRFAISEDGLRIRAVQGHSSDSVSINYDEKVPPKVLFHGTAIQFLNSILKVGLLSGARQYVHMSQNIQTATDVGQRHGASVVLTIAADAMYHQGFKFHQADNGVWLINQVPPQFLALTSSIK
ncbi:MAG: RNA 2'-phosphotransferase [Pseudomonadota bacterium]